MRAQNSREFPPLLRKSQCILRLPKQGSAAGFCLLLGNSLTLQTGNFAHRQVSKELPLAPSLPVLLSEVLGTKLAATDQAEKSCEQCGLALPSAPLP